MPDLTPDRWRIAQRFIVWIGAAVASIDTIFNAVEAAIKGEFWVAFTWLFAAAIVVPLALIAEKVKAFGGE